MSILRVALLASSSTSACRRPAAAAAAAHLCEAANHRLQSVSNAQHFRICISSFGFLSTACADKRPLVRQSLVGAAPSSSRFWFSNGGSRAESDRPAVWTRAIFPAVSPIGTSVSRGGCSCRVGGRDVRRVAAGGNSPSFHLLDFADQQQRPHATGSRDYRPAAASVCFSAVGGRRTMRSRGNGNGQSENSRRASSPEPVGAVAEDGQSEDRVGAPLTDLEKDKFKEVEIKPTSKLLTLPTVLTLARVAAVPAILAVFYSKEPWATSAGAVIFVLAAVTDWLDGYLARKMGTSSAFGAFLDPVADKLMVAAALVLLCTKPLANADLAAIPWLLPVPTIAIIGREITMSAVREWAASQGGDLHKAVAVNSLGKIKTASQMVAITLLLVSGEGGLDSGIAGVLGVGLLYVAAGLALWSLGMYMRGIWGSMFK